MYDRIKKRIDEILAERRRLADELERLSLILSQIPLSPDFETDPEHEGLTVTEIRKVA